MNALVLESNVLRAVLDADAGTLLELTHKPTGWRIHGRRELARSFEMLVPLEGRRNNPIHGARIRPSAVRIIDGGKGVEFTWGHLPSRHGELDITFIGRARLTDFGLEFSGTVDNRTDATVEGVAWPCIGDLTPPSPADRIDRLSMAYCHLRTTQLWPAIGGTMGYFGTEYPTSIETNHTGAPFIMLQAPSQGLYVGYHDPAMRDLHAWFFDLTPGVRDDWDGAAEVAPDAPARPALAMKSVHFAFVAPGQKHELAPVVLQPYSGDWHAGADLYKAWRKTWFTRPAVPRWAEDVHSWQQIQMNDPEDSLYYRYSDLPAIAAECRDAGVAAIQLVGWNIGGQDRGNPLHDPDPTLGTRQELMDAIAAAGRMGVRMVLFTKFTWADASQPWYRRGGSVHAVRDPYGDAYPPTTYLYETWTQLLDLNGRRLVPMCHASAAWREAAAAEMAKVVGCGADGMLYDECQHHGRARCCFAEGHGHRPGAFVYGGDVPMIRRLRQEAAGRPEFLLAGEACLDTQMQEYHLSYFRTSSRAGLQMHRYIGPDLQMMVAVTGQDARNQLLKCLQYRYIISYEPRNFKGRLGEFPRTLAFGRRVDDFRRRHRAWLWDAEFRDTRGAAVRAGAADHGDYSVFVGAGGRRAVVVANTSEIPLEASVDLAGPVGQLVCASPDSPAPQPTTGKVLIGPRDVAVVMER
jgi:hypothetical protein